MFRKNQKNEFEVTNYDFTLRRLDSEALRFQILQPIYGENIFVVLLL